MQYFIADTHFFHADLLGDNDFAPRLFPSVEAMDDAMIQAWNARVDDRDVVYHLGDIAMNPEHFPQPPEVLAILLQLHGRIVFIKGNHDYESLFKYLHRHDPGVNGLPKFTFHSGWYDYQRRSHAIYYDTLSADDGNCEADTESTWSHSSQ